MFGAGIAIFYGVAMVGRSWLGPVTPSAEISRSLWALPAYAGYSLLRITIAYVLSLGFALGYGYVAASNARAERFAASSQIGCPEGASAVCGSASPSASPTT